MFVFNNNTFNFVHIQVAYTIAVSRNSTLGPKTRAMVTVVLNWVRMKPKRYFISGPTLGNRSKLMMMMMIIMTQENIRS